MAASLLCMFAVSSAVAQPPAPTASATRAATNAFEYRWAPAAGATWYQVWVNDPGGPKVIQWVTASEAKCPSGLEAHCHADLPTDGSKSRYSFQGGDSSSTRSDPMSVGGCQWWVRGHDGISGTWSIPREFWFSNVEPAAVPIAEVVGRLNTISSNTPNGVTADRWTENGDGTATDKVTGLIWELKTDDSSIHDKDDNYTWSTGDPWAPDGTAYTVFLATLNTEPCFAGHCDWRLPTIDELQTLIEPAWPDCSGPPCTTIPGETESGFYWSSSTRPSAPADAWGGGFNAGIVGIDGKEDEKPVRAVRGGS